MKNKFKKILLTIFILIYVISICPINLQNDTFYDIKLGEKFIESGVYSIDNFSVHDGLKYQTHHFLVDIIVYKIYSLFGFIGLHIFEIILTCLIAILFYLLNNKFTKSKKISYILVFLEMFMFEEFISLRGQMFSTIIFLIEMILINKFIYNKLSKTVDNIILIALTLLPVILINFHGGVVSFYYIILIVYLMNFCRVNLIRLEDDKSIDKKKLGKIMYPLFISLPLLLLNPYGINGITYMFKTLNNDFINSFIQEFQSFNIKTNRNDNFLLFCNSYNFINT